MSASASSSSEAESPIPSPTTSFPAYHPRLLSALSTSTKLAAALPAAGDVDFHRSLDRQLGRALDGAAGRVLGVVNRLIGYADANAAATAVGGETESKRNADAEDVNGKGKGKQRAQGGWDALRDAEDVEDRYLRIVDVTDALLERADIALDELMGRSGKVKVEVKEPTGRSKADGKKPLITATGRLPHSILNASIPKPQLAFRTPVNNFPSSDWTPAIHSKPHAQVPLGWRPDKSEVDMDLDADSGVQGEATAAAPVRRPQPPNPAHPYYFELTNSSPPASLFAPSPPLAPQSFDSTPFTWVSTPAALAEMLGALRASREIALDLEHHDYRSYYGVVCLMQVSNRERDWVVDTLALREELEVLNEVLADPAIVKVLHGAQMDIIWLQRDFNLYIVNLFDTYHASKTLQFPAFSLAFLLELYCEYKADKRFQLADWRIRPLPEEMLNYARSDTHFLLFIYDHLRNDLLQRAQGADELIRRVLSLSADTALQYYTPEPYDPTGWGPNGYERLAKKWNKHFDGSKRAVYRALHAWRDRVARAEDESLRFVLPNHQLFALAEQLPRDAKDALKCLAGATSLAVQRADEIVEVVKTALEAENAARREEREKQLALELQRLQVGPLSAVNGGNVAVDPSNRYALLGQADDAEEMDVVPQPVQAVLPSVDVWAPQADPIAVASSSLFGAALPKSIDQRPALAAASSSLFGGTSTPSTSQGNMRYQAAIARVHGSLFLAPTAEQSASVTKTPADVAPTSQPFSAAAVAEVPFVPKAARQAKESARDNNSIIVVGQKHSKKRKRDLTLDGIVAAASGSASASPPPIADTDALAEDEFPKASAEDAVFDYSTVPNLLDADPATLQKPKKRKKDKGKRTEIQSSEFKKPPKARTEPKTGNRSMTFK